MKVVLVDPMVVFYKKIYSDLYSFTGSVRILVSAASFEAPPQVWKLDEILNFTKMFKDVSPLTFKIEKKEEEVTVLLFSDTKARSDCVLERLFGRFQDQVRISMMIQFNDDDEGEDEVRVDFARLEEMPIENKSNGCISTGTSITSLASLDLTSASFHFKITVDIPDECFENSTENVSPTHRMILETGAFTDVIIVAGNGAEIKAHKCFLCTCSSVLAAMFLNDIKEAQTGRVEMIDMTEQGVRAFLQFVYCGDLTLAKEDPEIAFELLQTSHKYDVPNLEGKMVTCLMDVRNADFPMELAFNVYMFVRNLGSSSARDLKRKCIQIFDMKPDELKALQKYQDLFKENPKVAIEVSQDFLTAAFPRKRKLE